MSAGHYVAELGQGTLCHTPTLTLLLCIFGAGVGVSQQLIRVMNHRECWKSNKLFSMAMSRLSGQKNREDLEGHVNVSLSMNSSLP